MPFIFILFFAVVVAAIIFGAMQTAKRRKEREEWAAALGLQFDPSSDYSFKDRYPQFTCFRSGDGDRYAYNIAAGRMGSRDVVTFDYHYETYSTDSKGNRETTNHYFSGVIVESDLPLKPLFIRPEGLFDKVTAFFGHEDINFESAEFSKKFYVTAADKKWAYDVLHVRTMEFLLQRPKFTIQFDRDTILVTRSSTFSLAEFEAASQTAQGILDALPEYVVKQQREGN